jgi:hypothetical protein
MIEVPIVITNPFAGLLLAIVIIASVVAFGMGTIAAWIWLTTR